MSDAMVAEIKSLGGNVNALGNRIDAKLEPMEAEIKRLTDAIADIQRGQQLAVTPLGKSAGVCEGTKALIKHLRTGEMPEVQYDETGVKAASVANPPTGGYFAVPDFQSRVIERMYNMSPMRQICETINVNGNIAILPYEVQPPKGRWVGELEKRDKTSDARLGVAEIPVNEYTVKVSISNTLLEDSNLIGIEDYLINSASRAIDRDVGDAFVSGDGFKKPEGLYASPLLNTVPSGAASGVTTDMLFSAMSAVPNDALRNARWTMSMATFLAIVKQFGKDSTYYNMPLADGFPAQLMGYPVTFINAPSIAAGNTIATFGDHYAAYKIIQRLGLQYQRDDFTGADDNLVITRFRTRVGGQLVMPEAVVGIRVGAS